MLDAIRQNCVDYYNDLPIDTFQSVGRSACVSFVVTMVISGDNGSARIKDGTLDFSRGVAAAVIAATATLVHALTTPLFQKIFGDKEIKFERELLKLVCNISLTYMILIPITPLKTHLAYMLFSRSFPLNFFKAELDVLPRVFNLFEPPIAATLRGCLNDIGMGVNPDENAAYYTLGF